MTTWQLNDIDEELIHLALQEDLGVMYTDLTTDLLLADFHQPGYGRIVSKEKEPIALCGLPLLRAILDEFETEYELTSAYKDGDRIASFETICEIRSNGKTLLMAERTLLNFLRHLCAIATITCRFVDAIAHTHTRILDTRKTTPGWRHLEKYAVLCGGGVNHRLGLYDAVMVKDTHVDLLGGMKKALSKLPNKEEKSFPVIVEVRSMQELEVVLHEGQNKVDRVLLDNMSTELMRDCVQACKNIFPTEASGNLNLNTIKAVAETGVDFASVGMITHSAGNVDLSLLTGINS